MQDKVKDNYEKVSDYIVIPDLKNSKGEVFTEQVSLVVADPVDGLHVCFLEKEDRYEEVTEVEDSRN